MSVLGKCITTAKRFSIEGMRASLLITLEE
jgi:hypothetical protein